MNYTFDKFGGINTGVDSSLIGQDAVMIENATVRSGAIEPVRGPVKMDYSYVQGLNSLMSYYRYGQHEIMCSGTGTVSNAIWEWRNFGWQHIATNLINIGKFGWVNTNIDGKDLFIFSNGIDPVMKYDGSKTTELKMLGKDSDYNNSGNRAPKGRHLVMHYDRLWIADDYDVYCSSVTANGGIDIEDFTTPTEPESEVNQHGAHISMYTYDGTRIVGMKAVFDDILIFKEKKIFKLYGTGPDNLQKIELFNATGAIAPRSIVSTPHGAFYINNDGIYMYNGSNVTKISNKIQKTWDSLFWRNSDIMLSMSVGIFHDNRYIVFVRGSSTSLVHTTVFEFDILTGEFTTRNLPYAVSDAINFRDKVIFACPADGYMYEYDAGEIVPFTWESGSLVSPNATIEVDNIKLNTTGTGKVEISASNEKRTKKKIIDITKDGLKVKSFSINGSQVKFKIKLLEGNLTIRKFDIEYELDEI